MCMFDEVVGERLIVRLELPNVDHELLNLLLKRPDAVGIRCIDTNHTASVKELLEQLQKLAMCRRRRV